MILDPESGYGKQSGLVFKGPSRTNQLCVTYLRELLEPLTTTTTTPPIAVTAVINIRCVGREEEVCQ